MAIFDLLNSVVPLPSLSSYRIITVGLLVVSGVYTIETLWLGGSSSLHRYPGPWVAKYTRLWYLYHAYFNNWQPELLRLHRKYGPIVRIAPNLIDVDMPELMKDIYDHQQTFHKTPYYAPSSTLVEGRMVYNLFSEPNPAEHKRFRKPVDKYYSPAAATRLEPHMDHVIRQFCHELETRYVDSGLPLNFSKWISFFTWDIIGAVTFSKAFGYLEQGKDFDGTLRASDKAIDYFNIVCTMPILDKVLDKNPIIRIGPPGFYSITAFTIQRLVDRYQGKDKDYHNPDDPDFLDRFIETKKEHEWVDDRRVVSWLMANMVAGTDTTAILMRSTIYYALKNPRVWARLNAEVRGAVAADAVPPEYKDVRSLPYLEAVIREAGRIHPGANMTLERYVPEKGYTLPDGQFLPKGTTIAMTPYVANRNPVFGNDVDDFRPERWLRDETADETEEAYRERLITMNRAELTFGHGARKCIGQNMALWSTYKLVATLITLYDFELACKEWKVIWSTFSRQEDMMVRMTRRK